MPKSRFVAAVLGALALFAIVAGAYAVTSDADSAEACRRARSCNSFDQRDNDDCVRPLSTASSINGCGEGPICQTSLDCCEVMLNGTGNGCCEVISGNLESGCCEVIIDGLGSDCCEVQQVSEVDLCEPPTCTVSLEECCITEAEVGTSDLCAPPPVCERSQESQCCDVDVVSSGNFNECCLVEFSASSINECCDIINVQSASECEPPCEQVLSLSVRGCDCDFPSGASISSSDCRPDEDRCELRSFRRIGRWPAQQCEPL